MQTALCLLDQAIELGRRELGFLEEGEVDGAERLAQDRGRLLREALAAKAAAGEQGLDDYCGRLKELKGLHGLIIEQAHRLHEVLHKDLIRSRQERRRLNGYGGVGRISGPTDRFISRKS